MNKEHKSKLFRLQGESWLDALLFTAGDRSNEAAILFDYYLMKGSSEQNAAESTEHDMKLPERKLDQNKLAK